MQEAAVNENPLFMPHTRHNVFFLQRDCIAVGFSDNQVHLLKYPSGEFDKILVRLQLPVRHVAFSPDGFYLAVAGECVLSPQGPNLIAMRLRANSFIVCVNRGSIKLVNLVDTTQVTTFKGHQGPVRSIAFDPKGDYFASTGADGTVRIWSLYDCSEAKCLPILPKGDPQRYTLHVATTGVQRFDLTFSFLWLYAVLLCLADLIGILKVHLWQCPRMRVLFCLPETLGRQLVN